MRDNDTLEHPGEAAPLTRLQAVPAASPSRSGSWRSYTVCLCLLDSISLMLGMAQAQWLRFGDFAVMATDSRRSYVVAGALGLPVWVATLFVGGAYGRRCLGAGTDEYRRVLDSAVRFLAIIASEPWSSTSGWPAASFPSPSLRRRC